MALCCQTMPLQSYNTKKGSTKNVRYMVLKIKFSLVNMVLFPSVYRLALLLARCLYYALAFEDVNKNIYIASGVLIVYVYSVSWPSLSTVWLRCQHK
jgi:hypothetical protein